ncbi:phage tail tape measure protein [Mesosutterella sp. AGMB02718]|uniref:Phage tail tape measure protein n=2 Tax=Mesosutterella TaxID=2494213 RepID=A0ABT7IQC8_9BURK|nr:phage tail tape measure protein [Mesosutterella sp. AGMB02718]MDL2058357.1 phage tail tape measure protein [Mesosutterella sp. AGMB02718]MDL2060593.1 phage tail tape measure protein [Mesosutterella sp. AGMB02718]
MAGQEYLLQTVLQLRDNLSAPLKDVRRRMNAFGRSIRELNQASMDLAGVIAKPFAILAGAGGFSIKGAVSSYLELADAIDKASIRAGVSVEALQKLRYGAQLSGMTADELDGALTKLTSNMSKAAAGQNADLVAMFKHLGIALKDSNGHIRSAADVMNNLAQAVKNNESTAARMQILTAAFGDKVAARLIPLLKDGAEGLQAFGKRAEELGLVMSAADVKAANEFGDQLSELQSVTKTLSTAIGSRLQPVLQGLIEPMEQTIVKCRDLIATNVQYFVEELTKELKDVNWQSMIQGAFDSIRAFTDFIRSVGGVSTILKAFGVLIGMDLVIKVGAFVKSIATVIGALRLLGVAAMTNPVGLVLTALAAGIALAIKFKDTWMPVLDSFLDKLSAVGGFLKKLFGETEELSSRGNRLSDSYGRLPAGFRGVDEGVVAGNGRVTAQSEVRLRIQTDKGTTVRTEGVASRGPMSLTTDYSYDAIPGTD